MTRKKSLKNTYNWSFFLMLLFLVLVMGLIIVLWSISRPFCANSLSCKESLSMKIENGATATFAGQKIDVPYIDANQKAPKKVLGEATLSGDKHIFIDLTSQTLTASQGNTIFLQTLVSTGKWFPTPSGEFKIWEKLRATRMTGGKGADYYDLPNVPYVMFFEGSGIAAGRGFGLHGTYWHNNFGHPMSHGCVNMRTIDAEKLFSWADVGTPITIYGQAPL